jgi:hypothetical protein
MSWKDVETAISYFTYLSLRFPKLPDWKDETLMINLCFDIRTWRLSRMKQDHSTVDSNARFSLRRVNVEIILGRIWDKAACCTSGLIVPWAKSSFPWNIRARLIA